MLMCFLCSPAPLLAQLRSARPDRPALPAGGIGVMATRLSPVPAGLCGSARGCTARLPAASRKGGGQEATAAPPRQPPAVARD